MLVSGSGIPMVPGAGNGLRKAELPAGILDDRGKPSLAGLDALVRGFLQENRALFLPDRGELVLNADRSGVLEDGRVAFVDYDWVVDGVPVEGARVFARINNGNLVQAGTRLVGRLETPTTPRLKAGEALGRALAHAGLEAGGRRSSTRGG